MPVPAAEARDSTAAETAEDRLARCGVLHSGMGRVLSDSLQCMQPARTHHRNHSRKKLINVLLPLLIAIASFIGQCFVFLTDLTFVLTCFSRSYYLSLQLISFPDFQLQK